MQDAEAFAEGGRGPGVQPLLSEGSTLHRRPQRMPMALHGPAVNGAVERKPRRGRWALVRRQRVRQRSAEASTRATAQRRSKDAFTGNATTVARPAAALGRPAVIRERGRVERAAGIYGTRPRRRPPGQ